MPGIELWSPIRPGLFMGGTSYSTPSGERVCPEIGSRDFHTVVTLFSDAPPAGHGVKELRLGFADSDELEVDVEALDQIVEIALRDWQAGKQVLVRCEGGWNRSGLVSCLILMRTGLSAVEAIDELRTARSPLVLSNRTFEQWLVERNAGDTTD